jgi:ankyrin repeat protein
MGAKPSNRIRGSLDLIGVPPLTFFSCSTISSYFQGMGYPARFCNNREKLEDFLLGGNEGCELETMLYHACGRENLEEVKNLMENGADPTRAIPLLKGRHLTKGTTVFRELFGDYNNGPGIVNAIVPQCFEIFMDYRFRFRRLNVSEGQALLNTIVRTADVVFLQKMLAWGFNINDTDSGGGTPLMHAVQSGRGLDVIKWLLDNGANIDAEAKAGRNVLHCLSEKTGSEVVQFLLEQSPNLAKKRFHNKVPLHRAVSYAKDPAVVEVIAQASRDCINEKNKSGLTPLAIAVIEGKTSFVEILCRYGANPNEMALFIEDDPSSLLEIAAEKPDQAMVDLLIKYGARYDTDRARRNAERIAECVKQCLLTNSVCGVVMSSFDDMTNPLVMYHGVRKLHRELNAATSQYAWQPSLPRPALSPLHSNSSLSALPSPSPSLSPSVQSALQTPASLAMTTPVTLSSLAAAAAATTSSLPPLHPFAKGSSLAPAAGNNAQSSEQEQKNNSMQLDE